MSETTLPALNGNDRRTRLDDIQLKRIFQAKPDTIVHLKKKLLVASGCEEVATNILLPLAL